LKRTEKERLVFKKSVIVGNKEREREKVAKKKIQLQNVRWWWLVADIDRVVTRGDSDTEPVGRGEVITRCVCVVYCLLRVYFLVKLISNTTSPKSETSFYTMS
jgi:hypothetical protein